MQLQNFECQIAKAQIGRFLAGDGLSEETLSQLEAHIAKCPDCKQNLAERRASLQAKLAEQPSAPAKKLDLASFLKSKLQAKQPVQAAVEVEAKPTNFTKPMLYSLALGAVLIGMSYASKNMGSVLGPKAAEASPAARIVPHPEPFSFVPEGNAIGNFDPEPLTTHIEPKPAQRKPPQRKPSPKRESPQPSESQPTRRHHHSAPRPATNRIRIYAPENL